MKKHRNALLILLFCLGSSCFITIRGQSEDSTLIDIHKAAFNSNRSDFSPFLNGNTIYFTSGRVHRYGVIYYSADTSRELLDIFETHIGDSASIKTPHPLPVPVNGALDEGPLCINKKGDLMYITINDTRRKTGKNRKSKRPLSIYFTIKTKGHWIKPSPLSFCTDTFSYCHPALLSDESTLIFSSNKPGGYGGMDLYKTRFVNGTWSEPENLGNTINSSENEVFPFASGNKLYFATSRANGLGGLDIYYSEINHPEFAPISLPEPINSNKDDFGIWTDSTGLAGYFSSNREGNDDIYSFKKNYPDFSHCAPYHYPVFCFTFFEESALMSKDTLGMEYEWDLGGGTRVKGLRAKHCFQKTGKYQIQLNIIDKSSGQLFFNELNYEFEVNDPRQIIFDCPDTLIRGKSYSFDSWRSAIPGYSIRESYWSFGDNRYAKGISAFHRYHREGLFTISINVKAVHDSSNQIKYFCQYKQVLVKDSQWIADNKPVPNIKVWPYPIPTDSIFYLPKGDSINYRVHLGSSKKEISEHADIFDGLREIGQFKDKNGYHYTTGKTENLTDAIPYYKEAKKKGFKDAVVVGFNGDSLVSDQRGVLKGNIEPGKKAEIQPSGQTPTVNIYFRFNKPGIDITYRPKLDSIGRILKKDRGMELIILAGSDTVGSKSYNLKLSSKRADAIRHYLIGRGVQKNRMEIITLGESLPEKKLDIDGIKISGRRVELLIVKNPK